MVSFPIASALKLVLSLNRPSARIVPHIRHTRRAAESLSPSSHVSSSLSSSASTHSQNIHPAEASPVSILEPSDVVLIWTPSCRAVSRRWKPPCRTGKSWKRQRKKACAEDTATNLAMLDSQKRRKESKSRALPTGL